MNARALTLTAVLLSSLSFPLTITGASVALPGIQHDLDTSLTTAQWVVNGYNLCFAAFLAFGGSLADLLGKRRLFTAGVAVFLAGSVLCVLARDATVLNLARVLAGTGAAAATATGQSILAASFGGPARTRVFGALGAVLGVGLAFGPTISGLLVDALGWRAVFAVPAALAGVVLLVCPFLPALPGARRRIDWAGGTLFTAALALLIWAFVEAPALGASHPSVLAALLALVICGIAFVRVEKRGTDPMFDLGLLRDRSFVGYSLVAATMMGICPFPFWSTCPPTSSTSPASTPDEPGCGCSCSPCPRWPCPRSARRSRIARPACCRSGRSPSARPACSPSPPSGPTAHRVPSCSRCC